MVVYLDGFSRFHWKGTLYDPSLNISNIRGKLDAERSQGCFFWVLGLVSGF